MTARAGYARAVTARTELVLSKPEVNHNDEGSETYFEDPDGHLLEIITRPYGSPTRLRRQTLSHRQTPGNAGPPALHERIVDNLCTSVPGPPRPQEGDDSEQES